jgi:hypothetical protein
MMGCTHLDEQEQVWVLALWRCAVPFLDVVFLEIYTLNNE